MNNHECGNCPYLVDVDAPCVALVYDTLHDRYYEDGGVLPLDAGRVNLVYFHKSCAEDIRVFRVVNPYATPDTREQCHECGYWTEPDDLHDVERYDGRYYEPGKAPVNRLDPADGCEVLSLCVDCIEENGTIADIEDIRAFSDVEYRK